MTTNPIRWTICCEKRIGPSHSTTSSRDLNCARRRTVWHRQVRQVAMIAAAIAIPMATLVGFVAIQRHDRDASIVVAQIPLDAGPNIERRAPQAELQMVREPNAFEQAVVLLYRHERGLDQGDFTPAPLPEAAEPDSIAAAIGQLVDNPLLDAAELARELAASTANPQMRLVELCRHGSDKSIDGNAGASAAQRHGVSGCWRTWQPPNYCRYCHWRRPKLTARLKF